jgi:serine/threonine-protein kinase
VRGRYRVVSEIGAGAFGTVCLADDESTGHRVAIRFLPRNFANSPQAAQAVLRMGRSIIAASASHQAMARVLEFGELEAGRPFTVTEFVEGRRLNEMPAGGAPVDVHTALRLALELGGAIETLHNLGFVHGAVTPRNVVVLQDGRVKLLDVELSGLRDAREVQGLVNVDPPAEYLAPEQIQKAPVTEKTDIYAYGAILYELLSGMPPLQGSSREAIVAKHLKEVPVPIQKRREGVPPSVSRAVTLALYKQPDARPLMGDVLNLLWTGAHGPAPRSKRAALVAGGTALAVLAIGAVVWGALALRGPNGAATVPPTARPTIETPAPAAPAPATRKPLPPAPAAPREFSRAPAIETAPTSARAPEPAAPAPNPMRLPALPPAVSTPAVERAPVAERTPSAARPPAAIATPAAPETRPAPTVRTTPSAPSSSTPAAVAPPASPPAAPARPSAPAAQATTTAPAPRPERRESAPEPQQTTASPSPDRDDSRAVIDWLLNPRTQ